jgi:hypothetical protein
MSSEPEMLSERDVWGQTLVDLGAIYPEMLVLDGDLAQSTKADLFDAAYPDRFIQCGIAEQNMAGMAAGLATLGFTPWLSSFAVFLVKRILDQLRMVIAQPNQIISQVVFEYAVLALFGAIAGALIGVFASNLFIPYFRFTGQMAAALPPLLPIIAQDQVRNLTMIFAGTVVLAEVLTITSVLRRQLFAILKTTGV